MEWQYHPQEIVWRPRGESGPARALAARLRAERPTAWVGHGASFESSLPEASEASSLVCTGRQTRWLRSGHPDLALQRTLLRDCDLVVVEGRVESAGPWVVELDPDGHGLEDIPFEERSRVSALVGPCAPVAELPPGGIPRFGAHEMDALADHLMDTLETAARRRPLVGLVMATPDHAPQAVAAARAALATHGALVLDLDSDAGADAFRNLHTGWGQAGLLLSAMERHPAAAVATLEPVAEAVDRFERLMSERDPLAEATAFRARDTHMPSPACAVWEPRSRGRILGLLSLDVACLRRTLVASATRLLDGF